MNPIIKDDFKKRLQENISSYPEAKIHSAKLDLDFGFDCAFTRSFSKTI